MAAKLRSAQSEKRLTISLPKDQYELVERIAENDGVSKSKIIRDAIKLYLNKDLPLFQGLTE